MNRTRLLRLVAATLIIAGLALSTVAVAQGQMRLALIVIFPVFYAEGLLAVLGIVLIFIGMLALLASFVTPDRPRYASQETEIAERGQANGEERKARVRGGAVVLLGPIPIVFGSDWRMAVAAMILAILLIAIVLLLML